MDNNRIQEKFLEMLKSKSKDNPDLIIRAAMAECLPIFKKMCSNEQGQVGGDMLLYQVSRFAGIACLRAGTESAYKHMLEGNGTMMPISKLDTEAGIFYIGDSINKYLFMDKNSIWNYIIDGMGGKIKNSDEILKSIIEKCAKNYGNKDFRIWNNQSNPYNNLDDLKKGYNSLLGLIKKYELKSEQIVIMYGMMLSEVIKAVKGVFPKNLNVEEMCMETVLFNAHMDLL